MRGYELAALAAQIANMLVDENGLLVYGEVYDSKDETGKVLANFSTHKCDSDTHTALVISTDVMQKFAPLRNAHKLNRFRPTQLQMDRAKEEHAALIAQEVTSRTKSKEEK